MTKEKPFSATFKLEKETKHTVRYAEEAEGTLVLPRRIGYNHLKQSGRQFWQSGIKFLGLHQDCQPSISASELPMAPRAALDHQVPFG